MLARLWEKLTHRHVWAYDGPENRKCPCGRCEELYQDDWGTDWIRKP